MAQSLWMALGGRLGMTNLGFNEFGVSVVDEILQRPNATLEDLLDVDEVIQEAKFCNSTLLDFLSTKPIVEQLVRYTIAEGPMPTNAADSTSSNAPSGTAESSSSSSTVAAAAVDPSPPAAASTPLIPSALLTSSSLLSIDEDSTTIAVEDSAKEMGDEEDDMPSLRDESEKPVVHQNAHTFPYKCSELLCGEVGGVIDVLIEDDSLLTLLFSILDRPAPLDPSSVSYFRKVLQVLIQRKYTELVSFCARNDILPKLLRHLGLYSILELIIMLGWDGGWDQSASQDLGADQGWMLAQGLIPKLVRKLHPRFARLPDVHAHAGRLLVDVVVKCPLNQSSPLVEHLQTTSVLRALFGHMFSNCSSSLSNSLSVIIVLVQRFANRRLEQCDSPAVLKEANEEDFEIASGKGEEEDASLSLSVELVDDALHPSFEAQPSRDPAVLELGEPFISLLPHLPRILALLQPDEQPPVVSTDPAAPMLVPGVLGSAPFGSLRMKVVELCLVLARSRSSYIDQLLADLGVAQIMLDVFLAYPWNNLLHGLVESIVTSSLEDPEAALTVSFFTGGRLVKHFLLGWQTNEAASKKGKMRLGYMGHLIRTAATVNHMLHTMPESQRERLLGDSVPLWKEFTSILNVELESQQSEESLEALLNNGLVDLGLGLTQSNTQMDLQSQQQHTDSFLVGGQHNSSATHYLDDDSDDSDTDDEFTHAADDVLLRQHEADEDDENDRDEHVDEDDIAHSIEFDMNGNQIATTMEDLSIKHQNPNN